MGCLFAFSLISALNEPWAWALGESSVQESVDVKQLLGRAQRAIDAGKFEEAVSFLREVLEVEERNNLARQALVDVLMRLMRWDEAQAEAHLLRLQFPKDPRVSFLAAAVAFRRGQFERASQLAQECLALDANYMQAYNILALSRFMLQDYEGFKTNLVALIERDPNNADAHYHLGRYYYEKKLYLEALAAFNKATELDPRHYKAHYFLGWCQRVKGDLEEGKKSYKKAVEIIEQRKVNYGWAYSDLGELLIIEGKYDEGLGWLYRGIRNDPQLPYSHLKYASALLQKETSKEIENHLQLAVRLDSNYVEAYYVLGRYYRTIGDKERAREAFTKFQELRKNPQPSPYGVRR